MFVCVFINLSYNCVFLVNTRQKLLERLENLKSVMNMEFYWTCLSVIKIALLKVDNIRVFYVSLIDSGLQVLLIGLGGGGLAMYLHNNFPKVIFLCIRNIASNFRACDRFNVWRSDLTIYLFYKFS